MTESFSVAIRGRWRPAGGFAARVGRRAFVESLSLLTAPVTAAAGLLLVLSGLCAGTAGLLAPGGSPVPGGRGGPAASPWHGGPLTWSGGGSPRCARRRPGRGTPGCG